MFRPVSMRETRFRQPSLLGKARSSAIAGHQNIYNVYPYACNDRLLLVTPQKFLPPPFSAEFDVNATLPSTLSIDSFTE